MTRARAAVVRSVAEIYEKGHVVSWYQTIFELIDMRSFSNLWFWIALAVLWSSASHWVLGVPFDMVVRARKQGGQAAQDLHDLVGINTRRMLFIAHVSGLWLIGFTTFFITVLIVLGFVYGIEFAQAVVMLAAPMTLVWALALRTARSINARLLEGEALYRTLGRHRMTIQGIGMMSIFFTSLWGMWQNMQVFNLWMR
jgi:ABC-type protease/lipase transport system fused ATPase/permease subunit